MGDATPDWRFERLKLERQAQQIRVNVANGRRQETNLQAEAAQLQDHLEVAEARVDEFDGAAVEDLDSAYELERARLAVLDAQVRLQEIDGNVERIKRNRAASEKALDDIADQLNGIVNPDGDGQEQ